MRERFPCVYIVASARNGTLYTGVTSDLPARVWQHRNGTFEGFSKRHRCSLLVWFEPHETMESAISREKQIKEWNRKWKLRIIEEQNPGWDDLYESLF
jgi:putative endonuclease